MPPKPKPEKNQDNVTVKANDSIDLASTLKELSAIIKNADGDLDNPVIAAALKLADVVQAHVIPMISAISAEELERQRSVVILGIPEPKHTKLLDRVTSDRNVVYNIMDELSAEAIPVTSYRLGKPGEKPRLLKVVFATRAMQRQVIKAAKNLKDSKNDEFKRMFIRPSLTREQRDKQRELIAELKERRNNGEHVKIFKNEIVAFKPNQKNSQL